MFTSNSGNVGTDLTTTVLKCLMVALAVFATSLLLSLPVMWLWNWLMPHLFGLTTLTWLESWGLTILCNFLFKSPTNQQSK